LTISTWNPGDFSPHPSRHLHATWRVAPRLFPQYIKGMRIPEGQPGTALILLLTAQGVLRARRGWRSGARYYSPKLGGWASRDPVGERGGTHLYCFVTNRPFDICDYLGLSGNPACDADGNCVVTPVEAQLCGQPSAVGPVLGCEEPPPPPIVPYPIAPPTISSHRSCGDCRALSDAINRVLSAVQQGDCRQWFIAG
jgi:hypothetical protein